ncbi:glycosyltransferase [Parapedobacter koreensis]|uniref:Glycosyltransferase involved in cell wall bisynthesis n=1 Tax=Parapedobacter koreensis TaxID=332977 RepID=A0A1H7T9L6_9SPHI|nr:glycosyltransferase [Parapedobacter koreensis]SEL80527.1 Glycosyltransferase involved in cell wall bisynthesis [Parapedobacter koreensis]
MKKIYKVAHLTSVHPRYDNRILYKQCVSLAKAGFQTYLIVADGKQDEVFRGVQIIDVGAKRNLLYRITRIACKIYKRAKKINADIYQIHDPELLLVAYWLNIRGKKVIYDVHEDYRTSIGQKKYLNVFLKKLFTAIYILLERRAAENFTILLAEKYYKEYLPNGYTILNYPILEKTDTEKKREYNLPPTGNDIKLLYTGNITEVRGALTQSILVDKVTDVSVTFIGYCTEDLAKRIWQQVDRKNAIVIIGINEYIPQDKIKDAYKSGDWLAGIALFPKTKHYEKKELTKFFEYMLNGLPIICSDFPAWKQFVEDNQCGIAVDPLNYTEIQKAIDKLLQNAELRSFMGSNGRRRVTSELNWASQEKLLVGIYNHLIDGYK